MIRTVAVELEIIINVALVKFAVCDISVSCLWLNKGSHRGFFWEIMSHGAGSCYYSLQTQGLPADAQTRSWEDHSKNRNVTLRDPHSLSHLFISLWVKPGKSSLCLNEISPFVPLLIFPSYPLHPLFRLLSMWRQRVWGRGFLRNARSCSGSWTRLHSSDFYCLEIVFSQRSFWSSLHTQMYSECKCSELSF